jgi:hypothetical protein
LKIIVRFLFIQATVIVVVLFLTACDGSVNPNLPNLLTEVNDPMSVAKSDYQVWLAPVDPQTGTETLAKHQTDVGLYIVVLATKVGSTDESLIVAPVGTYAKLGLKDYNLAQPKYFMLYQQIGQPVTAVYPIESDARAVMVPLCQSTALQRGAQALCY